ncbi:MAG TPA: methyltransferase domain-containing protein [Phycisphaerales bacterium]|nr:methyltransferase domain-containing protein [Phycisphaerales bacterium]
MTNTARKPASARATKSKAPASVSKELPRAKRSFIAAYIRNPKQVGALLPSSSHLARKMIRASGIEHARTVVEYGPGTGAFSGHIAAALPKGAKYFAVELSETMTALFRERHPKLHIHNASVTDLPRLLRLEGIPATNSVDIIFSGLPWASFPEKLQRQLLAATTRALRPGGVMLTFCYFGFDSLTPGGKRLKKLLPHYFARVDKTDLVLRNIPPAFVYRCIKGLDPTARS